MYYIYEIKNKLDGRTYIGQRKCPIGITPEADPYFGSGKHLKASIRVHGKENFEKHIISKCVSKTLVNLLEIITIKHYREQGKAEYNIANGGQGGWNAGRTISEVTKKKISKTEKGKKLTAEQCRHMSRPGPRPYKFKLIECIETGEVYSTNEWIKLGYVKAAFVAKGLRNTSGGLHFRYANF